MKGRRRIEYSEEIVNFIRDRFRMMPDREIHELLSVQFPQYAHDPRMVRKIRDRFGLKRTNKDKEVIMKRLVKQGVKRQAVFKMHETKGHAKDGDIRFQFYSNRVQWVIRINGKYTQYAAYLWEQHYGEKLKSPYCAEWIDLEKPLTIENLRKRKYAKSVIPIGGITSWKHEDRTRELIKLGDGNYQLLLPYLWRQHYGEIPPGMWVEKINPDKPTTIENLQLTRDTTLENGTKDLKDWYITGLLSKGKSKEYIELLKEDKDLIALEAATIKLQRLIKEWENGNSDGNTATQ